MSQPSKTKRAHDYPWKTEKVIALHKELLPTNIPDQSFLDSLFEAVLISDSTGEILVCNQAASAMLEIGPDKIPGLHASDKRWVVIKEDGTPFHDDERPFRLTLRTGISCKNVIMGLKLQNGSIRWLSVNSTPMYHSAQKTPVAVTSTFIDISEQRVALEKLKSAAHTQRLALSSLSSCFYFIDLDFRLVLVNRQGEELAKKLFGKDLNVGDLLLEWLPNEDAQKLKERCARVLAGSNDRLEYHYHLDGRWLWILAIYRLVNDDSGKPIGIDLIFSDITRAKEAELKLRKSEKHLQALFNSTNQLMALLDTRGTVIEVNDTALQFSGYRSESMIGKKIWEIGFWASSDNGRYKLMTAVEQAAKGRSTRYESRVSSHEKLTSFIDFSITPVNNDAGTVSLIIAEGHILDEQKRLEREVRQRELQLNSFMENIPAYAWITDEHHILRHMNPLLLKAYNITESIIGRSLYDIFPPAIAAEYVANNKKVFAENKVVETMERAIGGVGDLNTLQVFKFPLGVDHRGTKLMGGIGMDISAIVKAKAELKESNERYAYAEMATSDAIWDWDILQDRITLGQSSVKLFGAHDLLTTMEMRKFHIHPRDREHFSRSLQKAVEGKSGYWSVEYRFRTAKGRYKTVLDKAYILRDENKKAVRMIGAMQDVTAQRKLEQHMIQEAVTRKREVIKAMINAREKERKGISDELHDNVNQLLATCNLYIDVIRNHKDLTLIDECKEMLKKAINEIRNISHNLTPAAFAEKSLSDTIGELVAKLNALGTLDIKLDLGNIQPLEARMPSELKTAIYRIVQEQVNNTLKHAAAKTATIKIHAAGNRIFLEMRDDGCGFDPQLVEKGLGLDNIQSRVAFFNGVANFISSPGKGCTLKVEIPIRRK